MCQRLYELLVSSGIPTAYVCGTQNNISIVYLSNATQTNKTNAQQIVNGFDWSDAAEQTWILGKNKNDAVNSLNTNLSSTLVERNSLHIMYNQISGLTVALNRLTDAHNLKTSDTVTKLSPPGTWAQAVNALINQIQSE